jgi:hypothetical protein
VKLGISIVTLRSEYAGRTQLVEMVKVRDVDHPDNFALAPMIPEEHDRIHATKQERFDAALVVALKKFKEREQ